MYMKDLTKYERSRLCNCLCCGKPIDETQQFEFVKTKISKFTVYAFIHSSCILKARHFLQFVDEEACDDGK